MVSVCMATKNGATFLKEQLESILHQLGPEDEIVISDDCSGDETLKIIRTFQDSRMRLLENKSEVGVARNFENTLKTARGDYFFLADQDDIWLPQKIERMKRAMGEYDLVVSDCRLVDDNLRTKQPSFYQLNGSGKGFLRNLFRNSYMGCCMAFTRKLRDRALPFPADIPMHDYWIGLVAELYFRVCFLPDVLVLHRRHTSNASTSGHPSRQAISRKIGHRYRMVKNLLIHKSYAR